MKLTELIQELKLAVRSAEGDLEREVTGGYASDLLSDVLANGEPGNLWITLQIHQNIVAVASMKTKPAASRTAVNLFILLLLSFEDSGLKTETPQIIFQR